MGIAAALLLGVAGPADAAGLPTTPIGDVRVSVTTPSGWTIEDRGPRTFTDQRTTQLVVRRPGGAVDALLYPETATGDFCDATAEGFHCMPLRAVFGPELKMGQKGLLVTDNDADGVPEVAISMFTGGAHCCVMTVGYWREASGAWKSDLTNEGSQGGAFADEAGRVEVADPAFESMDWSYAATQPYLTYSRLVPGAGWIDVTTNNEHLRQITLMNRAVREFAKIDDAEEAVQAARAVRLAHRKALRQSARVASERRTYRRAYGKASARRLDKVLRTVQLVR